MPLDNSIDKPVRLGFIGAGEMASFSIYPSLYLADLKLVAACDLVEDRARLAAGKFGAARWYTDYREMWSQEDLDAVIIHMHPAPRQKLVIEAMAAGYHVLVPKPPATNLEDTQKLACASRESGRILMVNFQRRFSHSVRLAEEIVKGPSFGRLTQFLSSFCSGAYDQRRRRLYEDPVHAFLLDFAPHHLDLARHFCGEVTRLSAHHRQYEGRLALALALEFESGTVGTLQLNSNRIWWRNYDRVELTGEGEYLVLNGLWSLRHYSESGNSFSENFSDQRSAELTGDGLALIEFADAIRKGREPISSIHQTLGTMALFQTLYEAIREGRQGTLIGG